MQSKETIEEMFTRFNDVINELSSLGRHIPIDEQARKILRFYHKMNDGDPRLLQCRNPRTLQNSTWSTWRDH